MNAQIASDAPTLLQFFKTFIHGSNEFIIFDDDYRRRTYSYQQVANAAASFARRLTEQGTKPRDKAIIWSEIRPRCRRPDSLLRAKGTSWSTAPSVTAETALVTAL